MSSKRTINDVILKKPTIKSNTTKEDFKKATTQKPIYSNKTNARVGANKSADSVVSKIKDNSNAKTVVKMDNAQAKNTDVKGAGNSNFGKVQNNGNKGHKVQAVYKNSNNNSRSDLNKTNYYNGSDYIGKNTKELITSHAKDKSQKGIYNMASDLGSISSVDNFASNKNAVEQRKSDFRKKYGMSQNEFDTLYNKYRSGLSNAEVEEASDYGKKHAVKGSAISLGTNLASAVEGAGNAVRSVATGRNTDEYDRRLQNISEALRSGASNNIDSNVGKFAYNVGMSGADMLTDLAVAALTGGGSTVIAGLQAAQNAGQLQKLANQNGINGRQAGLTGLLGGGASFGLNKSVFNSVEDAILKPGASLAGSIGKGMVSEGAEEGIEDISNTLIDSLINRGRSDLAMQYKNNIDNGMSKADSIKDIAKNYASQVGMDMAAGAVSGGIFGGVEGASNGLPMFAQNNNVKPTNKVPTLNKDIQQIIQQKPQETIQQQDNIQAQEDIQPQEVVKDITPTVEAQVESPEYTPYNGRLQYAENEEVTKRFTNNDKKNRVLAEDIEKRINQYVKGLSSDEDLRNSEILAIQDDIKRIQEQQSLNNDENFNKEKEVELFNRLAELQNAPLDNTQAQKVSRLNEISASIKENLSQYAKTGDITFLENARKLSSEVDSLLQGVTTIAGGKKKMKYEYDKNKVSDMFSLLDEDINNIQANTDRNKGINNLIETFENSNHTQEDLNNLFENLDNFQKENGEFSDSEWEYLNNYLNYIDDYFKSIPQNQNVQQNVDQNVQPTVQPTQQQSTPNGMNQDGTFDIQQGEGQERTRSFSNTMANKTDLPAEITSQLLPNKYNQLTNKQTSELADEILASSKNLTEAYTKFTEMLGRKDAASVPLGYQIAKQYIDNGDTSMGVDIINSISQEMTRAGQFTQAAYITMLQSDPMAVLRSVEKDIAKINENGRKKFGDKWQDYELSPEEVQAFANIQKGDTQALQAMSDSVYKKMSETYPHTLWEKIYDLSKNCMLMNPRTHIRNVAANMLSQPLRSMSDRVASVGENFYKLFNNNYQTTQSIKGGSKAQKQQAAQYFDEFVKDTLEDTKWNDTAEGKVSSQSQLWNNSKMGEAAKKALKNPITSINQSLIGSGINRITNGGLQNLVNNYDESMKGSILENIRQLDYYLLGEVEDVPFVKNNFVNRLASYMDAQGINNIEDVPESAFSIALDEALKATFKDDNAFTKALSNVKKSTGKFGDILLPFVKTPANLAMRGIDYSPAGFIPSVTHYLQSAKSEADITNLIGELSKNVTGTALIALGYALAKKGIITKSMSDDKDEKRFQQMQGYQENAFHIGNTYYTYDWAQPSAIPLIIGTAIYEGIENSDKENHAFLKAMKSGGVNALDAWFELSPLKSVSEIMGGNNSYGDSSIGENVVNTIKEWPLTFIPSVAGATARATDPTLRNTYDKTSGFNTFKNQAMSRIPGLSKLLPASYDTWGNERTRSDSKGQAAIAQYINPGTLGNDNSTPIDSEIQRLFSTTGENKVFPMVADYSITLDDKSKTPLNNVQYSKLQKIQGQKSYELANALMQSDFYNGLSDTNKADMLANVYSAAKKDAQSQLVEGKSFDLGSQDANEAYAKGTQEYINYLNGKQIAKDMGIEYKTYKKKIEEGLTEADIQQYADNKAKANAIDMDVKTYTSLVDKGATEDEIQAYQVLHSPEYESEKGSVGTSEVLNFINSQNLSDEQKNRYAQLYMPKSSLNSKYAQRGIETFGESALYQIFNYKSQADLDGNGSLSQKEAKQYVNSTFKSLQEQTDWYYVLTGKTK